MPYSDHYIPTAEFFIGVNNIQPFGPKDTGIANY